MRDAMRGNATKRDRSPGSKLNHYQTMSPVTEVFDYSSF
jgi:hypothetical protein